MISFESLKEIIRVLFYVIVPAVLIAISIYDLKKRIIPDWLLVIGSIMAAQTSVIYGYWLQAAFGALAAFFSMAGISIVSRGKLGWGDAKMAAMTGCILAFPGILYALGTVWTVCVLVWLAPRAPKTLAFGALLSAVVLAMMFYRLR